MPQSTPQLCPFLAVWPVLFMEPRDKKSDCYELVLPSVPDCSKDLVVHRGPALRLENLAEHFRERAFSKWLALVTDLLKK